MMTLKWFIEWQNDCMIGTIGQLSDQLMDEPNSCILLDIKAKVRDRNGFSSLDLGNDSWKQIWTLFKFKIIRKKAKFIRPVSISTHSEYTHQNVWCHVTCMIIQNRDFCNRDTSEKMSIYWFITSTWPLKLHFHLQQSVRPARGSPVYVLKTNPVTYI